jgi:LytR cell envelope-related transcriptional attenuator
VLLLSGGGFGLWQYNQGRYYVGVQDGYVAIFSGTSRGLAGVTLSSLVQRSALKVSQLPASDRARIAQTVAQGGVSGARALVSRLHGQVAACGQRWQAVTAWPAREARYQAELAAAVKSKGKGKVPASDNPGSRPGPPAAASCAPATAFGVTVPPPSPSPSPSAAPRPAATAAPALPASAVTVDVYNGGTTPGLASSVSQALVAQGYKRGQVTDAAAQSRAVTAGTQVFYGQGAAANAAKIAKYFGARAVAGASLPARHVEVLLGTGSNRVPTGLAPVAATSPAQAPPASVPGSNTSTCGFAGFGSSSCGGNGGPGNPAPASTSTANGNGNGGGTGGPNFLPL